MTTVDLSGNRIGAAGARDFGKTLKGTQVTTINLSWNQIGAAGARDFGQTLQGTQVTTVDLSGNHIGDADARDFIEALQHTLVSRIDMSGNQISAEIATALAALIEKTYLIKLDIVDSPALRIAIEKNAHKWLLPYYALALNLLPQQEKNKHWPAASDYPTTKEEELRYAGGILMNVPADVRHHIVSFLPLMQSKKRRNITLTYYQIAKGFHPSGLQVVSGVRQGNSDMFSTGYMVGNFFKHTIIPRSIKNK